MRPNVTEIKKKTASDPVYFSHSSVIGSTFSVDVGGHSGTVVAHSPPTSELKVCIPCWPHVKKLENAFVVGWQFTVQNFDQLYVLVYSDLLTMCHNITDKVLDMT